MERSDFPHKNGVVGKIVRVIFKKGGDVEGITIFILTNPFQRYLYF